MQGTEGPAAGRVWQLAAGPPHAAFSVWRSATFILILYLKNGTRKRNFFNCQPAPE